jgi:hypothetical protein
MTSHWFSSDMLSRLIVSRDNGSTVRQAARASLSHGLDRRGWGSAELSAKCQE